MEAPFDVNDIVHKLDSDYQRRIKQHIRWIVGENDEKLDWMTPDAITDKLRAADTSSTIRIELLRDEDTQDRYGDMLDIVIELVSMKLVRKLSMFTDNPHFTVSSKNQGNSVTYYLVFRQGSVRSLKYDF